MAAFGVRFIGWVENIIIGAEGGMTISLKPHICIPSAQRNEYYVLAGEFQQNFEKCHYRTRFAGGAIYILPFQ